MGFGIMSALAGAKARELELDTVANNLANMQTTGFKEMSLSFASELNSSAPDDMVLAQAQATLKKGKSYIDFSNGAAVRTGNQTDFALNSDGFFSIKTPDGEAYTRNGQFMLNDAGQLVTNLGHTVLGESGPITLDGSVNYNVTKDGIINLPDGELVDKFKIVDFVNKKDMKPTGNNYYTIDNPEFAENTEVSMLHRHLESSNVNLVHNMTRIIQVSRAYESLQKSMKQQIDANRLLNQLAKIG